MRFRKLLLNLLLTEQTQNKNVFFKKIRKWKEEKKENKEIKLRKTFERRIRL